MMTKEFSLKWKSEINLPRISKHLNLIFLSITHNLVIQKHSIYLVHDQKSKRIIFQSLTLQYQACRHQFLADQLTLSQPRGGGGAGSDYAHQMILVLPDFHIFLRS